MIQKKMDGGCEVGEGRESGQGDVASAGKAVLSAVGGALTVAGRWVNESTRPDYWEPDSAVSECRVCR